MWWMITKSDCPWCDAAIDLIQSKGEAVQVYDITGHPMLAKTLKLAGCSTVPQVWCGTEYVGGYENVKKWYDNDN